MAMKTFRRSFLELLILALSGAGIGALCCAAADQQLQPQSSAGLIAPEQLIDPPLPGGVSPNQMSVAQIANNGEVYLIVWSEGEFDGEHDIMAARVTKSGQLLDPIGIPVCTSVGTQLYPAVASDGRDFLVVWWDFRTRDNRPVIFGARVAADGRVLDHDGFRISEVNEYGAWPFVASNGSEYLVTWGILGPVYGRRVSRDGLLLDQSALRLSSARYALAGPVASNGRDYLATWERRPDDDPNGPGAIFPTFISGEDATFDLKEIAISAASAIESGP